MPTQLETLFFTDPEEGRSHWQGPDARARLSHLAGDRLPLALFHKNADASSKQSRALVRWAGGRRCFRLIGVGDAAVDAVQAGSLVAARTLMSDRTPVRIELRQSKVGIAIQAFPSQARVVRMVVAKSTSDVDHFWNRLDDDGRRGVIAERVARGIGSQIETLQNLGEGDDLPEPDQILPRLLNIKVLSISDPATEKVRRGGNLHVDVIDANIEINAQLSGHWNTGWMGHLGYGRIEPIDAYHRPREPYRSDKALDDPEHPLLRRRQLLTLKGARP